MDKLVSFRNPYCLAGNLPAGRWNACSVCRKSACMTSALPGLWDYALKMENFQQQITTTTNKNTLLLDSERWWWEGSNMTSCSQNEWMLTLKIPGPHWKLVTHWPNSAPILVLSPKSETGISCLWHKKLSISGRCFVGGFITVYLSGEVILHSRPSISWILTLCKILKHSIWSSSKSTLLSSYFTPCLQCPPHWCKLIFTKRWERGQHNVLYISTLAAGNSDWSKIRIIICCYITKQVVTDQY